LETGAAVWAVEPNDAMRAAAESSLGDHPGFSSVRGSAEETGLADQAVGLVTCAQAFHWFDVPRCRREFCRILSADGGCALVWNTGRPDASEFSRGYEAIKQRTGEEFARVRHEGAVRQARCDELYGRGKWEYHGFAHAQALDFPGLRGRLLSSSYAPKEGHPAHAPMMAALRELFERCQDGQGRVTMDYVTEVYWGRPAGSSTALPQNGGPTDSTA
jgi:hypothetical protein